MLGSPSFLSLRAIVMIKFIPVALNKLNELIKRRGFIMISSIEDDVITIEYTDRKCTITSFGNVKWIDD